MAELALIRTAQGLVPATEADRETVQKWKLGFLANTVRRMDQVEVTGLNGDPLGRRPDLSGESGSLVGAP